MPTHLVTLDLEQLKRVHPRIATLTPEAALQAIADRPT